MKTQIFAYKGIIGIVPGDNTINDPIKTPTSFGYVIDMEEIEISQEAYDLLKDIPKNTSSLGDIDSFQGPGHQLIFAYIGAGKKLIHPGVDHNEASRTFDPKHFTSRITQVNPPQDFIDHIEFMELARKDKEEDEKRKLEQV